MYHAQSFTSSGDRAGLLFGVQEETASQEREGKEREGGTTWWSLLMYHHKQLSSLGNLDTRAS